MGKRVKKRLDLLTSDQAAAPQEVPRKRGRPRKFIPVKEKEDHKGDKEPDETGEEQEQQQQQQHQQQAQQEEEASSSQDARKDEEKAIQEQNQEEEKPSSSRGRRKSRKPLKST